MLNQIKKMPIALSAQVNRVLNWYQDEIFRRLFLNAGKLLSAQGIAAIIGLIVVVITARALGPTNYGILALVLTYEATIGKLVTFNAWQAIIKFGSEVQHLEDNTSLKQLLKFGFTLDVSSAVIGTILAIALSGPIISLLGWDEAIRELLVLYSILVLFSLSGTPIGILRLYDRFDLLSYTAVLNALIRLGGVTWCFVTKQSLLGFVIVYLVTGIIGNLYQLFASFWVLNKQGISNLAFISLRGFRSKFPGILDYVWTTNLNSTIRMLSRESDELIIAGLTTPEALGLYKVAKQFSKILPMLADPLYQSIYPDLSRLQATSNNKAFLSLIKRSTFLVGGLAIGVWLTFLVTGQQIIVRSVGQMYQESYWLAVWYMLALVIAIITFTFTPSMLALGLPKISLKILIVATLVYLVLLWPFIEWWGIIGAPFSYLFFYIIWSVLTLRSLRKHLRQFPKGDNDYYAKS